MAKRGQITLFIIMGIVLLISLMIIFLINSMQTEEPDLEQHYEPQRINVYLQSCLDDVVPPLIENISYNGGFLNRSRYADQDFRWYDNVSYFYHCKYDQGCKNRVISRKFMENELNKYIRKGMKQCLNLSAFEREGYNVDSGEPAIGTQIGVREVYVTLNYPISISKEDFSVSTAEISSMYYSDLGYLYDLAVQIVNNEIEHHFFDKDQWMRYNGDTKIYRHRPYPDVTYMLTRYHDKINTRTIFKFAIEGFEKVEFVDNPQELPEEDIEGYVYYQKEDNCFLNPTTEAVNRCNVPGSGCQFIDSMPSSNRCKGISDIMDSAGKDTPLALRYKTDCRGGCEDCVNGLKHGEAQCIYEGPTGRGWDYVGSRHYVQTCIDGELIFEECADYREEICVEDESEQTAICRDNRWEDCSMQTDEANCEDESRRDCTWSESLANSTIVTHNIKRDDHLCHPSVPPGFRHWKLPYNKVCEMASESRECDGWECPIILNNQINRNCGYQGDCGAARNFANTLTTTGFVKTNTYTNVTAGHAYLPEDAIEKEYRLNITSFSRDHGNYDQELFNNEDGKINALMQDVNDFLQEASGWDACDFCDCFAGYPIGDCVYDELTTFAFVCMTWNAPYGGDDCSSCNDLQDVPCTEYKCRSLGQGCMYKEEKGVGRCIDVTGDDSDPPELSYNGPMDQDNITIVNSPLTLFDIDNTYWVCKGDDCTDDVAGTDGLEPYTKLNFTIDSSEDVKCKTFILGAFDYEDVPAIMPTYGQYTYNESYTYDGRVESAESLFQYIDSITGYTNTLMTFALTDLDNMIDETYAEMIDLADTYGLDTTSINDFYVYYYTNISMPMHELIDPIADNLNNVMMELSANRRTVFVECIDRSGNTQAGEFLIEYAIGDDTKPPKIVSEYPHNGSFVDQRFELKVWFNEPSECRFALEDADLDDMEKMDCPINYINLMDKGYVCNTTINMTTFQEEINITMKCLDQPLIVHEMRVKFHDLGYLHNLTDTMDQINLTAPDIVEVEDTRILKGDNLTEIAVNDTVRLKLNNDYPMQCKYTDNGSLTYDEIPDYFTCSGRTCETTIDISVAQEYQIRCVKAGTTTRNNQTFRIKYFMN